MNDAAVIDICDASRSRSQSTKLRQDPPTMDVSASVGKDDVYSIDSNDESKINGVQQNHRLVIFLKGEGNTKH